LLPNTQLRTALKLIEIGKQCEKTLLLTEKQMTLLEKQMSLKDSIISTVREEILMRSQVIDYYKVEIKNVDYQLTNYKSQVKTLEKSLKVQKVKTFFTGFIGVAGMGILTYLLLK
jgi:signal recognition particle GTPase